MTTFRSDSWLVRVRAPHFCAGLVVKAGVCSEAAPILRWAIGKPWKGLRGYFQGKGYRLHAQPDPSPK